MTAWQGIGLLALAALLISVALLHVAAPASCADADAAFEARMYKQAADGYAEILDDEPESTCAKEGMLMAVRHLCLRANWLQRRDFTDEAKKAYTTALTLEPEKGARACQAEQPPAGDGGGGEGDEKVIVVKQGPRGPKGDRGAPGKRGKRGKRGKQGKQGDPGVNGRNGFNGRNGRNGRDAFCCTG